MTVEGPATFQNAVRRVMSALEEKLPALAALAEARLALVRYAPERLQREHPLGALARSDGLFAMDGTNFEFFRWVFCTN